MPSFNIFRAFSGSSQEALAGWDSRQHGRDKIRREPLRQVLLKRARQHHRVREEVPMERTPSRHATVEDYDDLYTDSHSYRGERSRHGYPSRTETTIPAVYRAHDDQRSYLNDAFSTDGSSLFSGHDVQHEFRDNAHPYSHLHASGSPPLDISSSRYPTEDVIPLRTSTRSSSELGSEGYDFVSDDRHIHSPDQPQSRHTFVPYLSRDLTPEDRSTPVVYGVVDEDASQGHRKNINNTSTAQHLSAKKGQDTYYIIPSGINVIFHDEHGNELTRVGDFSGRSSGRRSRFRDPIIFEDEDGREIYRTGDFERTYSSSGRSSRSSGRRDESRRVYIAPSDREISSSSGRSYSTSDNHSIVHLDRRGRETNSSEDTSSHGSGSLSHTSYSSHGTTDVILIDYDGRQVALSSRRGSSRTHGRLHSSSSGRSYSEVVADGIRRIYIDA